MLTLYTIEMYPREKSFYYLMNAALRSSNRHEAVKPWRHAIWLLLMAMRKLPPVRDRVLQRGVKKDSRELGRLTRKENMLSMICMSEII